MATPEPIVDAAAPVRWRSFYELTKPRVVMLIVFTSIVGTLLAVPGLPPLDALHDNAGNTQMDDREFR